MSEYGPETREAIIDRLANGESLSSIYGLYDNNGELIYIGKADDPHKRMKSHMREARSCRRRTPLYNWIRKHGRPELRIIEANCKDWVSAERRLIAEAMANGEKLLNVAAGGNEPPAQRGNQFSRNRDPFVWRFNRDFAEAQRAGLLTDYTKSKLRELASLRPKEFGRWAAV